MIEENTQSPPPIPRVWVHRAREMYVKCGENSEAVDTSSESKNAETSTTLQSPKSCSQVTSIIDPNLV